MYLLQPSSPDAPAGDAPSAPAGGGSAGGGSMFQILIFAVPVLLILFMMRNQNKKQKEVEASLKVGDRVGTRGGAIGKIVKLHERTLDLELAPGVVVAFRKEAIEGLDVDPKVDPKKADAKKADEKKTDDKAKDDKETKAADDKAKLAAVKDKS